MIDLDLIIESVPQLLQGLKNSLLIACISSIIGLIGGTIIAMIEKAQSQPIICNMLSLYMSM